MADEDNELDELLFSLKDVSDTIALNILEDFKRKIAIRQKNLTIASYKEIESEYSVSLINKLRKINIP